MMTLYRWSSRRHQCGGRLLVAASLTLALVQLVLVYWRQRLDVGHVEWLNLQSGSSLDDDEEIAASRRLDTIDTNNTGNSISSESGSGSFLRPFVFAENSSDAPASVFSWRDTDGKKVTCFRSGVDLDARYDVDDAARLHRAALFGYGRCRCRRGWYGHGCGVPEVVWRGRQRHPFPVRKLKLRRRARRVVNALPFNMEFDLLELRLAELGDVVDVLLVVESNYTTHGDPKPYRLTDRLRQTTQCYHSINTELLSSNVTVAAESGDRKLMSVTSSNRDRNSSSLLSRYCDKIVVVQLDFFPDRARLEGSIAERLIRDYLGTVGLGRVSGLRGSDLFVLNDADELPTRDVINFLRWHDGYTQPITLAYSLSVFNFGWGRRSSTVGFEMSPVPSVVTVDFLCHVHDGHAFDIRSGSRSYLQDRAAVQLMNFIGLGARPEFGPWVLGGTAGLVSVARGSDGQLKLVLPASESPDSWSTTAAGWHCSWCLPVDGIRTKLTSAQRGDFPRWGDYPAKLDLNYIRRLVECGVWFDDRSTLDRIRVPFTPRAVADNVERYGYLLPAGIMGSNETTTNSSCLRGHL